MPHIVFPFPVSIFLPSHSIPQLNTHQIVIVVGCGTPVQSYAIFLFKSIQWTTGDSSGGKGGRSGNRAQVGHSSGDGSDSMTIPGSSTTDLVHLPFMRDTGYLPDNINTGIFVSSLESGALEREEAAEVKKVMIFLCKCYHRNRACCSIFPSQGCILCIDCRSGNIDQVSNFFILS